MQPERAAEKKATPLSFVRDDVHFDTRRFLSAAASENTCIQSAINKMLEVTFEAVTKVLEHSRSSRQNDILRKIRKKDKGVENITLYKPRRTSMGDCWMTSSTISGRGVKKSDE